VALDDSEDVSIFFDTADFATTATYTPTGGGSASSVTVIFDKAQIVAGFVGVGAIQAAPQIQVRKSEVANPRNGDSYVIDGVTYSHGTPTLDPSGKIWTITLNRQ
jgi:hypothetical protein